MLHSIKGIFTPKSVFSLRTESILVNFKNFRLNNWYHMDYFNDVLTTLNVSVVLLSMQGQKALGFHQKYLHLCSEDERRSYRFGTTWGWEINDRIFIFGWTNPLRPIHTKTNVFGMKIQCDKHLHLSEHHSFCLFRPIQIFTCSQCNKLLLSFPSHCKENG